MNTIKEKQKSVPFNNDVFFKYALLKKGPQAKQLREGIIEEILHKQLEDSKILNPEIVPDASVGKEIRLDILLKEKGHKEYINIEMQVSNYTLEEAKRFQFYGSRLISNQDIRGERYGNLLPVIQIIFIDDVSKTNSNLINCYQSMDQEHIVEMNNLVTRYFIHLPIINEIVKEKGIEDLSEFEKVCYLFKNNLDDAIIKATKKTEGMARILIDRYNEFPQEKQLWSWAMAREDERKAVASRIEESRREGIKEGKEEGIKEVLYMAIKEKYHQDASAWLQEVTPVQASQIMSALIKTDDFEIFKQTVEGTL